MARETLIRVRVDDQTDDALEFLAQYNGVPKAQLALHLLLEGLDGYARLTRSYASPRHAQDATQKMAL